MDVQQAADGPGKKSLRLLAWAWAPVPQEIGQGERKHTRWTREEVFCCSALCRRSGSKDLDDGARASRNCTLPGFNPNKWKSRELVPIWMGQPPRYEREGEDRDWFKPLEDAEEDGCPGGWYRCGFTASLQRYRRIGSEHKVENLLLSRCEDKLVLEAIAYLEDEERHSLAAFYEARDSG